MFDMAEVADRCRKAALDDVALADDDELCAAAIELSAARAGLDAAEAHVLGELEARGICDREYGLSTTSWLTNETRAARPTVAGRVRVAVKLRTSLDAVDRALGEGRIGFEHARVLTDAAANPRITDTVTDAQDRLLDAAEHAPFAIWRRAVTELVELWDQDGGYDPDRDLGRNRLSLNPIGADHTVISGELTGEHALIIDHTLKTEADRLFRRYHTDQQHCPDLPIPPRSTLLALALVETCRKATTTDTTTTTGPATDITVVTHHDHGNDDLRTLDGHHLDPDHYRHWLCDPVIRPLVLDQHGLPLHHRRSVRYATPAQRRALTIRDGGCVLPGCDAPATWTDAHHVTHWDNHGNTDIENLALLCRHHHRITHRHGWTMTTTPNQHFTWTTPSRHTLHSQRQRGRPPDG